MKKTLKKADGLLLLGVLLAAGLVLVGLYVFAGDGQRIQVTVDGRVTMTLPLEEDTTLTLHGVGGDNTLVIAGGTARVTAADCPDGLCVRHRPISRTGESIICLPHRLTVTVVGGTPAVDGEV